MKRETYFKIILISFFLVIFLVVTAILIYTGKIHFTWSDKWLAESKYEENKSMKKRILVLGDSQLEKWPLEHCLSKDIETFCVDNNIGCINAAHHGFGPIEYIDRTTTIAPDYKPDMIILFYYVGNDLSDVLYRPDVNPRKPSYNVFPAESKEGVENRKKEEEKIAKSKQMIQMSDEDKQKLINNSKDFNWKLFEEKGIDPQIIQYAKNRVVNPSIIGKEYVNPWLLVNATYQPDYLIENTMVNTMNSRYAWYRVAKYLEKIARYAQDNAIQLCLVCIPNNTQVDTSHYDFYRKTKFNVIPELIGSDKPQVLLNEFATHFGITYVNLLPSLKSATPGTMFFENDDHLSEQGHIKAFEQVKTNVLTPYMGGQLKSLPVDKPGKFCLNYLQWAIPYQAAAIKNSPEWFNKIKEKKIGSSIPIDSVLADEAKYVIEHEE